MMSPAAASIRVEDVTVRYNNGHTAIYDFSLDLEGGMTCALVGVNGSGKSTLFKSLMGLLKPRKGDIPPVRVAHRAGTEKQSGFLCAAKRRSGLAVSRFGLRCGDAGALRLHEYAAHSE